MGEEVKWYLRRGVVLVLLFFVLGFLALPLLYKSPKFSRTSKIILSIIILGYTLYFIFAMRLANIFQL